MVRSRSVAPNVRVVILNYNGGQDVVDAVRSVTQLEWPADHLDVVVVDNASTDGSAEAVAAAFDQVTVIPNRANTGFSANNLGLGELDKVDFVGLVNPDATVDPQWLSALLAAFDGDEKLGAACPRILLNDQFTDILVECARPVTLDAVHVDGASHLPVCERVWQLVPGHHPALGSDGRRTLTSGPLTLPLPRADTDPRVVLGLRASVPTDVVVGGRRHTIGPDGTEVVADVHDRYDVINNAGLCLLTGAYGADRGLGVRDQDLSTDRVEVFGWSGGGVLLSTEYVRDVGLFDDLYFLYYDDADMSWRGRARGWTYRYEPSAVMWHKHSTSTEVGSSFFRFHNQRSRVLFILKHLPLAEAARALLRRGDVPRAGEMAGPGQPGSRWVSVRMKGRTIASVLLRLPTLIRARRRAARQRTQPAATVLSWIGVEP